MAQVTGGELLRGTATTQHKVALNLQSISSVTHLLGEVFHQRTLPYDVAK
ncbi:MAG: hypothetical protein ACOYNZ_18700 [Rhodoferax sp.]